MSVNLMSIVFKAPITDLRTDKGMVVSASTCAFVLLALADNANENGESIYPSIATLCKKTKLSEPTVIKAINALRTAGILELVGASRLRTNQYNINIEKLIHFSDTKATLVPENQETKATLPQDLSGFMPETKATLDESSLTIIKPPDTTGEDIREKHRKATLQALQENEARRTTIMMNSKTDWTKFPAHLQELAQAFIEEMNLSVNLKKSEFGFWIEGLEDLYRYQITPEVVRKTVRQQLDEGIGVFSPKSILKNAVRNKALSASTDKPVRGASEVWGR